MLVHIVTLAILTTVILGEEYCYSTETNPYRGYATKTPYREISRSVAVNGPDTLQDCTAQRIWLLARHGTRYPGDDDIAYMNEKLPQILQDADLEEALKQGLMCAGDVEALRNWKPTMVESDDKRLAAEGKEEHRELAGRYKTRFPELLTDTYEQSHYEFRHTDSQRTADSARAFAEGLFGDSEDVQFIGVPEEQDWLLKYYDNCEKYNKEVGDVPVEERDRFESGSEMESVMRYIENRLLLSHGYIKLADVEAIFDACIFEYGIYGPSNSSWCTFFPENITSILEYYEDLEYYWEDAYGHEINYEQSCGFTKDIYDTFTATSGPVAVTRFGHSANINTFLARLGLFKDDMDLRADAYESNSNRKWRTSLHTTMASNIVFVQYSCDGTPDDTLVFKVFVNEENMSLPVKYCTDGVCRMPESLLKGKICDIEEVCKVDSGETDDGNSAGRNVGVLRFLFIFSLISYFAYNP